MCGGTEGNGAAIQIHIAAWRSVSSSPVCFFGLCLLQTTLSFMQLEGRELPNRVLCQLYSGFNTRPSLAVFLASFPVSTCTQAKRCGNAVLLAVKGEYSEMSSKDGSCISVG